MATGIVQVAWILRYIRARVPMTDLHFHWESFSAAREGLLLWEAFVTGAAKGETHEQDAKNGIEAFCDQLPEAGDAEVKETESPLSLVAAAATWAGWDVALEDLRSACVLVRA